MTKFSRLLALVLVVALMANFVVPGLAVDASEGCQCDPEFRTGTYLSTVAATCVDYGYDVYVCDDCGKQYSENLKVPTGEHTLNFVEAKAATCTEIGWEAYEECAVCDYTTYVEIPALGHTEGKWAIENKVDATCDVDGSYDEVLYCDTCRDVIATNHVTVPAFGHVVVDATCTDASYCEKCGEIFGEPNGHKNGEAVIENLVAESCTVGGSYDVVVYCTVCGEEVSRETVIVPANKHYYGFGPNEIKEATCTTPETHIYVCLVCQYVLEKPVGEALGHVVVDATCTEESYCSRCEEVLAPANGHDYTSKDIASTCKEEGYTEYTCSVCGDSYKDNFLPIDPLAHNHGITKPYQAPTCVAAGWTAEVACFYCGDVLSASEEIPVDPEAHKLTSVKAKAPDCTNIGWEAYEKCELCDYTTYVEIPALGHDEDMPVVENLVGATCTVNGSYDLVVYCCTCFEEISRDTYIIPASGHSYDDVVTAPTCTKDGYTTRTCKVCGDVVVVDIVPALGHTEGKWALENMVKATCTEKGSYNEVQYCDVCHEVIVNNFVEVPAFGHTEYGSRGYVDPTCTTDGYWIAKCYTCGTFIIEDKDSALGHNYEAFVTDPTCEEGGYTTYICCNDKNENEKCNHTYVDDYVDALGHEAGEIVIEMEQMPSCTVDGSYDEVTYCVRCAVEMSRMTVPVMAPGHVWDEGVVTDPDCDDHGYTTYTCTCCGETSMEEIVDALGHVWVDADCENPSYCVVCGETSGEALGHVEIVIPGYAPTFDASGLTDGICCEVCGKVIVEQVEIAPLSEEITFSYKAYGINGSANAVNSGYITVEIWMNVNTDIARLWAVDLDINFNSNLTLIGVSGCIFEQSLATPMDIANELNAVKLTQDMGYSDDKIFEKGEYLFATLEFKVDKDFYSQDASFIVNMDECTLTRKGEFANDLFGDFGTGVDIHVNKLGDANLDGKITSADTMALSTWFETADLEDYEAIFDMNKDGYIDGDDFALLRGAVVRDNSYLDI